MGIMEVEGEIGGVLLYDIVVPGGICLSCTAVWPSSQSYIVTA
jgi:hypothetical protein